MSQMNAMYATNKIDFAFFIPHSFTSATIEDSFSAFDIPKKKEKKTQMNSYPMVTMSPYCNIK